MPDVLKIIFLLKLLCRWRLICLISFPAVLVFSLYFNKMLSKCFNGSIPLCDKFVFYLCNSPMFLKINFHLFITFHYFLEEHVFHLLPQKRIARIFIRIL